MEILWKPVDSHFWLEEELERIPFLLLPNLSRFWRYYEQRGISGATRIDRQYHWGNNGPAFAEYKPVAFFDHLAHTVKVKILEPMSKMCSPRSHLLFKIRQELVGDQIFQERVHSAMGQWEEVKREGLPVPMWLEIIVKPGIRKIAMDRSKEMNEFRRGRLNLFILRQGYLVRKLQQNQVQQWGVRLAELVNVQHQIQSWYWESAKKIQHQARVDEFQESENTRIDHHEIHRKHIKKSSILKLQTDADLLEGHAACADHLESLAADLLLEPATLKITAQEVLLNEVTESKNKMLGVIRDQEEVRKTLADSNLHSAPGTDGITSYFYKVWWNSVEDALTEVAQAKSNGEKLTPSMRTARWSLDCCCWDW